MSEGRHKGTEELRNRGTGGREVPAAPAAALAGGRRVCVFPGPPAIWIEVPDAPWNARDMAAWRWPEPMKPSAWAEKYRHLVKTALPGPWRNDHAPYLRGIMDLAANRSIGRLTIKKAAQIGVSESLRTLMGYWAHQDPAPMGLALPNKEKGEQIARNDVRPVFTTEFSRHPELKELLSRRVHDLKKGEMKLANSFILYLMWSGSPASMASNPMQRAISDEVDKFAPWSGNDADPISLIDFRLRTYPDRIHILCSTPTVPTGMISQAFEASPVKLYYLVPCPHCGTRQRLLFGEGGDYGVKWSEEVRQLRRAGKPDEAAALVMSQGVHYECCHCHGSIDERQKRAAVRAGRWGTIGDDGLTSNADASLSQPERHELGAPVLDAEAVRTWLGPGGGCPVGMQIGSLYCAWESWTMAHVAAEVLKARTQPARFAFRTSTLGETWADQVSGTVAENDIDRRVQEATRAEGVVPAWAARLIAVADTQKDHFWLVIRAWGPSMRSARVWHGKVSSFEELEQWCFRTPWKSEDSRLAPRICDKVLIDSGGTRNFDLEAEAERPLPSRVMDVYAWALKHSAMVHAIKGDARPQPGQYLRRGQGEYVTDRERKPVPIWLLDVHHWHDQLADLLQQSFDVMDAKTGEVTGKEAAWQLNTRGDPEYGRHMSAMHKAARAGARGGVEYHWEPKREGMRVDYRACEAYQVAGAYMTGVHLLPELGAYMAAQEAQIASRQQPEAAPRALIETSDGRAFVASRRDE